MLSVQKLRRIPHSDLKFAASYTPIAQGAFGKIYKAWWKSEQHFVAVKKITNLSNEKHTETEFNHEALLMEKSAHDSIVKFYGVMAQQRHPVLILEFMELGSLEHLLEQEDKSEIIAHRMKIALNIIKGLAYLHTVLKILHRDLNNSNILLTLGMVAKISDFGFATSYNTEEGYTDDKMPGTLWWLPPEFVHSHRCNYSPASDMHTYGTFLWSLYSLCHPFKNQSFNREDLACALKKYPREKIPTSTPAKMHDLIMNLWSLDPKSRKNAEETKDILLQLVECKYS